MNSGSHRHLNSALDAAACTGAAWIDSGIAPGLVVVDANRPAIALTAARKLHQQSGAAP